MKTKRTENYVSIRDYVYKYPNCSILEISKGTGINWETVKYALETMIGLDIIDFRKRVNATTVYFPKEVKPIHPKSDDMLKLLNEKEIEYKHLICPNCHKNGGHNMVTVVEEDDGSLWYVCGYCNTITSKSKTKDESKKLALKFIDC